MSVKWDFWWGGIFVGNASTVRALRLCVAGEQGSHWHVMLQLEFLLRGKALDHSRRPSLEMNYGK